MIKDKKYLRRKARVSKSMHGVGERPRLTVFRSNKHIYAQIIDDETGKTLVSFSDADMKTKKEKLSKTDRAVFVGEEIAKMALSKKIKSVIFDRGAYRYHGRVKTLADAARKGGLIF